MVDAEEDFDWQRPVRGVPYDVDCMRHLSDLQGILAAYGAVPTYMLTYPVLQDAAIVAALCRRLTRGQCVVGIQLHPWVTPPFSEAAEVGNSFHGNLTPALEEQKLLALMRQFRACFGQDPVIFRAGRYGLGPHTTALLEKHGFVVDTSLAPCTSFAVEGGPDFSACDYDTFWFGRSRRMLELPLCRSVTGWGGQPAGRAYRWLAGAEANHPSLHLAGLLARMRCAERITLSPEGNDDDRRRAAGRQPAAARAERAGAEPAQFITPRRTEPVCAQQSRPAPVLRSVLRHSRHAGGAFRRVLRGFAGTAGTALGWVGRWLVPRAHRAGHQQLAAGARRFGHRLRQPCTPRRWRHRGHRAETELSRRPAADCLARA